LGVLAAFADSKSSPAIVKRNAKTINSAKNAPKILRLKDIFPDLTVAFRDCSVSPKTVTPQT
jgi:hypothetical protein